MTVTEIIDNDMETAIYMLGVAICIQAFVIVFITYGAADPKRYARSFAKFFVAVATAYTILSLFYAITKYVLL